MGRHPKGKDSSSGSEGLRAATSQSQIEQALRSPQLDLNLIPLFILQLQELKGFVCACTGLFSKGSVPSEQCASLSPAKHGHQLHSCVMAPRFGDVEDMPQQN
eukprot:2319733-Rhodomonas_salina.1